MSPVEHAAEELTADQHRQREHSLTPRHAAQSRMGSDATVLKCDDTFLVADPGGNICCAEGRGLGLFYRDTRYLSRFDLTLEGQSLIALSSQHGGGDWVVHVLENEAARDADGGPRAHELAVCRYRTAADGAIRELLTLTNYGRQPAALRLRLRFEADLADVFRARSLSDDTPGRSLPPQLARDRVLLHAMGEDGWERAVELRFAPVPAQLQADTALFELTLEPRAARQIDIGILLSAHEGAAGQLPARRPAPDPRRIDARRAPHGQALVDAATQVHGHPVLDKIVRRSLLDLSLLRCRLGPALHYIAGGVPWYVTLFGRDSALTALQLCAFRAQVAGDTLRLLARHQATLRDPYRDAQPGKILHELRRGQLAHLRAIPQSPAYYGSVDSTLLFLILFAEYVGWSGDLQIVHELRGHFDAALGWIERYGDSDGDGYLDYGGDRPERSCYSRGLVNQGWKDSGDAIINADGSLVVPPVALCEVQGYLYRAWRGAAQLLRLLDDRSGAATLEGQAAALRARFERDFWSEELGCYLLARQQAGRPAAVVSSNAGQVLWGGIGSEAHATAVVERMMAQDMFSGWGVRTLSSREQRYNPLSYHLGSVWPHDNSLLCAGFRHYGADAAALRIFDALFDAASGFRDHRMPELYCGFPRGPEERHPIPYPVACSPQAWAAAALPYALASLLGLQADAIEGRLRIVDPILPQWLDHLELRGLRVGGASVDLRFERGARDRVEVQEAVRAGQLRVQRTTHPAPRTEAGSPA